MTNTFDFKHLRASLLSLGPAQPRHDAFLSPWARQSLPEAPSSLGFPYAGFSFYGMRVFTLPESLYRQPDAPLKSRPKRKPVRAQRKRLRGARSRIKARWPLRAVRRAGRRIKSTKGLPRNFAYLVNASAWP